MVDLSQGTEFCRKLLYFFWKFCFSLRTSYNSWFDVPTTQKLIFILFLGVGVLFEGAFSLCVSLRIKNIQKKCLKEVLIVLRTFLCKVFVRR